MISAILFDRQKEELSLLHAGMREALAMATAEESRVAPCLSGEELKKACKAFEVCDMHCVETVGAEGIRTAEEIRRRYPLSAILLVVEKNTPPGEYIRPSIMASSLLVRPLSEGRVAGVLEEFVRAALPKKEEDAEVFYVETRDGVTRIPFADICFFEACMKKISVRLRKEEYTYYDTLEHLEEQLPPYFVRCHRSLIVNLKKAKQYIGAENLLCMEDGSELPVSRTYKSRIREMLKK